MVKKYFLYWMLLSHAALAAQPITDYLLKPSGRYGVSFKDLHWVNYNVCPDPNFSKRNKKNFSSDNKKYCHELMVRIYYPTTFKTYNGVPYYQPIIKSEQARLGDKTKDIEALSKLKSHTIENAPVIKNTKFPVLLFISGLGGVAQLYENMITELVSHGYIVVGINSVFINGDIVLPNNRIVSMIDPKSWNVVAQKTIPIQEQDIAFVYKQIHNTTQNVLFRSMDLKHIGVFGHSFGGRAIANVTNQHEKWFQALATLDMEVHMGSFEPKNSAIPSMHIISAYWKSAFNGQKLHYQLNTNSYLVTLSPAKNNIHYSYHMNFTDFSTLQYLPVYQDSMALEHSRLIAGEDILIKSQGINDADKLRDVIRPLYLIYRNGKPWNILYYEPGKKATEISIETIAGLKRALNNFPIQPKEPEFITIKKIIHAWHHKYGNYLGNGNGLQITKAINVYLLDFFNTFLKGKKNPFKHCSSLTHNTCLECGPAVL